MKQQVWRIDDNGFYTGESYFVEEPSENEISEPIFVGYVKPKWNGLEWMEGATEQEIQEWQEEQRNQPKIPSKDEILEQELANTNALILELTEMILGGM